RPHRDLPRLLFRPAQPRHQGPAARAAGAGRRAGAARDGRHRGVLRLRRHLLREVSGDLDQDGRRQDPQRARHRRRGGAGRRPRLPDEHRRPPAPHQRADARVPHRGSARRHGQRHRHRRTRAGDRLMEIRSREFPKRAVFAIRDANLQQALDRARDGFIGTRAARAAELPEFEQLREEAKNLKNHILENLDFYLEKYEAAVTAAGGHVHWARDAAEARRIILDICKRREARTVCKGKSMISEEIGLNEALIDNGMEVVETDLGEYIIQLAGEPPSHIIAPAVHKTKKQITELFAASHKRSPKTTVPDLVNEAREILREKFFQADVGITGGNFLIAETGSSIIVTNEGNGDLTQTLGKVHIVTTSIEKVVPTLDDAT